MHSSEEPHIQALLDWFEEIHHQMVRDVVAAEGQVIFVSRPAAFHELRLEAFILEEPLLVGGVNGSLAG